MSRTPEAQYARHFEALKRREDFLSKKVYLNSYEKAELSALQWVLYHITYKREDKAKAIDSIENYQLMRKKGLL